jgi:hypothetical protein
MSKSIALITVHGMGDHQRSYHEPFETRIRETLGEAVWQSVVFRSVYYQDILQKQQDAIFDRMEPHVRWKQLRKFLLFGFSDAASLEAGKEKNGSPYVMTQERIRQALDEAFDEAGGVAIPVVILAHSLGCQVVSNYIWDADPRKPASVGIWTQASAGLPDGSPRDTFRRLRTLRRLSTTGCNIPIFVAGHAAIDAITPPNEGFTWHNLYDVDDALGWPLKPLSKSYEDLVEDIPVRAGNRLIGWLLKSWNPLSHGEYWTNRAVLEDVAEAVI